VAKNVGHRKNRRKRGEKKKMCRGKRLKPRKGMARYRVSRRKTWNEEKVKGGKKKS